MAIKDWKIDYVQLHSVWEAVKGKEFQFSSTSPTNTRVVGFVEGPMNVLLGKKLKIINVMRPNTKNTSDACDFWFRVADESGHEWSVAPDWFDDQEMLRIYRSFNPEPAGPGIGLVAAGAVLTGILGALLKKKAARKTEKQKAVVEEKQEETQKVEA